MKIKYIAAIFIYFVTFTLSVLIVGIPVSQSRSYKKPCVNNRTPVVTETELQTRLRKFLEADHQTGIELANDKTRLSASHSWLNAEKIATFNLVEKMRKVECGAGMPKGFCLAWDEHADAWQSKAKFLDKGFKGGTLDGTDSEEYRKLNERISQTYQAMIAAARQEGVDFRF